MSIFISFFTRKIIINRINFMLLEKLLLCTPTKLLLLNRRFRLALQNTELLNISEVKRTCVRNILLALFRYNCKQIYFTSGYKALPEYANSIRFIHKDYLIDSLGETYNNSVFVVLHSGEYWTAIYKILLSYRVSSHFIFYRSAMNGLSERELINSLSALGHQISVFEKNSVTDIKSMIKLVKNGANLIILPDIPSVYSEENYGSVREASLLGKKAWLHDGWEFIVKRANANVYFIASYFDFNYKNYVWVYKVIHKNSNVDLHLTMQEFLNSFLKKYPESWYYLPVLESYFHNKPKNIKR
ncbi:hypothetical protein [Yersinia enterocolitica]|uniref:hypothetical protein n=1 Tax=Yersinia enterocolitica TaxID=630 RepID=UPI001C6105A5|nr:hypothetical protein [Yersinia enterocolitica]MBW5822988.1 hypothetical protein [Yersinia enterocolitica]MBW5853030.1 hypothetical protein [Yersinia enterocolitica]MBW5870321.1 hypothetical protein [Yersinia enterocolitica]MBW5879122.1 hypothetical protein [Yersinia enterocolitica]